MSKPITINFTERELEELLRLLAVSSVGFNEATRCELNNEIHYSLENYHKNYYIFREVENIIRDFHYHRNNDQRRYEEYFLHNTNIKTRIYCSTDLLECPEALTFLYSYISPQEIELYPVRTIHHNYNLEFLNASVFPREEVFVKFEDDEIKEEKPTKLGFFND